MGREELAGGGKVSFGRGRKGRMVGKEGKKGKKREEEKRERGREVEKKREERKREKGEGETDIEGDGERGRKKMGV